VPGDDSAAGQPGLTLAGRPFAPGQSRIVLIGGGVMGPGIALTFAEAGFQVDLCDTNPSALESGLKALRDALQLKIDLGLSPNSVLEAVCGRVSSHTSADAVLSEAALVIEAVSENRAIKAAVFAAIGELAPRDAVVWSNTSTLNVFELAPASLVERLLVAHWFAPPHIMPLVEVVASEHLKRDLQDETMAILSALGKVPVALDKFIPGFIINRLLRALGREAFHMIETGVITPAALDAAVRTSLAPRMQLLGVMQRYDYTGLHLSLRNLQDPDIHDAPVDRQPSSLAKLVGDGHHGVTTGRGFYDYGERSNLQLLRERDTQLWRIVTSLGDLVARPEPL
jgi:3-hydroxybutyryl-CoA dehydrogenase